MIEIASARLALRGGRESDLADLHAMFGDPTAMAYGSTEPHASLDVTRAWLRRMIELDPTEGEDFVIEYEDRVVGKAGLTTETTKEPSRVPALTSSKLRYRYVMSLIMGATCYVDDLPIDEASLATCQKRNGVSDVGSCPRPTYRYARDCIREVVGQVASTTLCCCFGHGSHDQTWRDNIRGNT
jgi:hypothetical protein